MPVDKVLQCSVYPAAVRASKRKARPLLTTEAEGMNMLL